MVKACSQGTVYSNSNCDYYLLSKQMGRIQVKFTGSHSAIVALFFFSDVAFEWVRCLKITYIQALIRKQRNSLKLSHFPAAITNS